MTSPSPNEFRIVWVPCPDRTTATLLARGAVEEKLAACAHLLAPTLSIYEWEGTIHEDNETVVVLKTKASHEEALRDWILERHPYDLPCTIAWSLSGANAPYLSWLTGQLKPGMTT